MKFVIIFPTCATKPAKFTEQVEAVSPATRREWHLALARMTHAVKGNGARLTLLVLQYSVLGDEKCVGKLRLWNGVFYSRFRLLKSFENKTEDVNAFLVEWSNLLVLLGKRQGRPMPQSEIG